jgi:hypothetical protein
MIFKMYNCDFGIKINGQNYDFDHVASFTIEDPESVKLLRGANSSNKEGLVYVEGSKEPKKIKVTLIGMTTAIFNLLQTTFKNKDRVEAYCVDRVTGSSKIAKNAVIAQMPTQLNIDDSVESMNVELNLESFNLEEVQKDA